MGAVDRVSFSGHETFPFRYTWLRKAVREVQEDGAVFNREDAMVRFGVGKNMVGSMRHWGVVSGVLEEDPSVHNNRGRVLQVTPLGKAIFGDDGWDPYLEDPATLWLLHWQIATNRERATTWAWAFGHLPRPEFSRTDLQGWLMTLAEQSGNGRTSDTTIARDVDCFVRTYVAARQSRGVGVEDMIECPLVELNLVREFGGRGHYVITRRAQPSLPDGVFAYALASYLAPTMSASATIPLDNIAFAAGAPGRVFSLSEDALLQRLGRIASVTKGALALDETAGLRQILVHKRPEAPDLLAEHYERTHVAAKPRAVGSSR